jgi:hypothetical protein
MSKNSAKQMYTQLTEWLATAKKNPSKTTPSRTPQRFSKMDTYKNVR